MRSMLGDSVAVVLCCMCRLAYGGYVAVAFTPGSFGPRLFRPQPGKGHPAIVWIHITAIHCTADGGFAARRSCGANPRADWWGRRVNPRRSTMGNTDERYNDARHRGDRRSQQHLPSFKSAPTPTPRSRHGSHSRIIAALIQGRFPSRMPPSLHRRLCAADPFSRSAGPVGPSIGQRHHPGPA